MNTQAQLILALLWLSFGVVHSLAAATTVRVALERLFGGFYRIVYNIVAGVQLAAIIAFEYFHVASAVKFARPWFWSWPATALEIAGWIFALVALAQYDIGRLLGFTQMSAHLRKEPPGPPERLMRSGVHRYMRHPLYAAVFIVLWARIGNELELATAIWASLYLLIGTYFEERKLLREFGPAYAAYRARVPALVPWRGRALD